MRPGRGRTAALLAGVILCFGLLDYARTFGASFAGDDIDYLNEAADVRAGAVSLGEVLMRPHHEHLVPALRLAVQASVAVFGVSAFPFRLFVFFAHGLAAFFLGLVALRYTRRGASAVAAGGVAAASGGFSSLVVWFPTAGFVPVALAGLAGAAAALAWQDRLGTTLSRVAATAGIALALASESTFAPLVVLPLFVDALERRGKGKRPVSLWAVAVLGASAAWVLASRQIFVHLTGRRFVLDVPRGVPRGLFLLLTAPYRLLFPGASLDALPGTAGSPPIVPCLIGLGLLGLFAWHVHRGRTRETRPLLAVVAAFAVVCGSLVLLAGLGRAGYSYWDLFDADRYFYPLLPAVALAAALAIEVWPVAQASDVTFSVVALVLAAEVFFHARAVGRRFPSETYAAHERRLGELAKLPAAVAVQAAGRPPGAPPLVFPDVSFTFDDVHNGRLSARLAFFVAGDLPAGVVLGKRPATSQDESLLEAALQEWAEQCGESRPFFSIADGELVDARHPNAADFRARPESHAVVSGLSAWEPPFRWAGPEGILRLRLDGPQLELILQAGALERVSGSALNLSISVDAGEESVRLDPVRIETTEGRIVVRKVPTAFFDSHRGAPALVRLESDVSFDPGPGSTPERWSVRLYRVRFMP